MFLLLLLAQVAAIGVIFDNILVQVVHSVHQELKTLLQVVAGMRETLCQSKGLCLSQINYLQPCSVITILATAS